jgi:hypothetical protein
VTDGLPAAASVVVAGADAESVAITTPTAHAIKRFDRRMFNPSSLEFGVRANYHKSSASVQLRRRGFDQ